MAGRVKGGVELLVVALFAALVAVLAVPLVPPKTVSAEAVGSPNPTLVPESESAR